jgi:carbamoyl-phosphate synthase large subunit
MSKLIGVDTYLGPEMKSTGEVMGIDTNFPAALTKALMSADLALKPGTRADGSPTGVLLSIADRHKTQMLPVIHGLHDAGFTLYATEGTAALIEALGLPAISVEKGLSGGHPNVVDVIEDGSVACVINTPEGRYTGTLRDGFYIRRAATEKRIPCFTSIDTARAAVSALTATLSHNGAVPYHVRPINEYREGVGESIGA